MKIVSKIKAKISKFFAQDNRVETSKEKWSHYDISKREREIIKSVEKYTMTSPERIVSLIRAVKYIEKNNLEGDIVECGVWKGGSIMAVLKTLSQLESFNRKIFLYDTFEGMSAPSAFDTSFKGESAKEAFDKKNDYWDRIECNSSLEEVKNNIRRVNYPDGNIMYVQGKVEETIPGVIPDKIAILRLDTDWYESTLHELENLFPKLVKGGIIIIDDYGHWEGCRKAVDEYIEKNDLKLFLNRVDYTCRIGVKNF